MKILQINTVCDFGSTGRTTRELAEILIERGHEAYVAYGHGTTTFQQSFKIGGVLENHFHNLFYTRILGLHGYGTKRGTKKLLKWIETIKPDVIHLRNLHANYINFPLLFKYIVDRNIPVVLTLHDCFNFTGKCSHYTAKGCYKWQNECFDCPVFRNTTAPSLIFDHSRRLFNVKKQFYSQISNMVVVAVSKWLKSEAERSMLSVNGNKVTYIYNWIDPNKFYVASNEQVFKFWKKYKLQPNIKYLISVSQGWDSNASRYIDAIRLSNSLPPDYKLILIGTKTRRTNIPKDIIYIPYISNSDELSAAYTMSEAYVHLSVEDTFGKVIAEAMSCGAVPITFDSTACGEVPGPYGIVVRPHDINAIIESLPKIKDFKYRKEEMIDFVHANYDYRTNAEHYLNLYKEITH